MQLPINGFKEGAHFTICPKQGHKTEGVVLNRVRILGLFFAPNMVGVSNPHRPTNNQILVDYPPPPPAGGPAHPDPKIRDPTGYCNWFS